MTDPTAERCPPADVGHAITVFRQHAFAALLTGDTPRLADIAETASRDTLGIAQAITWLEGHGQLEREGERLIGAHGLTRRTTPHALTINGRTLHTWCAYDAIAIPAALGTTARAQTTCPTCHRDIVVDIDNGDLPQNTTIALWLPGGPCEHVIDDFCASANLFCTSEHLDTWRIEAGDPPGHTVTLAEIPALARKDWADIA